mmetsp:Transcript_705/g.1515  ORF Transcript_705/g.1515 Transcript_705/m.1515 type:complete len:219 (+) Transcript_705:117-773(+)
MFLSNEASQCVSKFVCVGFLGCSLSCVSDLSFRAARLAFTMVPMGEFSSGSVEVLLPERVKPLAPDSDPSVSTANGPPDPNIIGPLSEDAVSLPFMVCTRAAIMVLSLLSRLVAASNSYASICPSPDSSKNSMSTNASCLVVLNPKLRKAAMNSSVSSRPSPDLSKPLRVNKSLMRMLWWCMNRSILCKTSSAPDFFAFRMRSLSSLSCLALRLRLAS